MCERRLRLAIIVLSVGFGLFAGSGCANRVDALSRQLESKDPTQRIHAIHTIGNDKVGELIPALVDRLDDDDPAVRLYTIVALEKLTGERFGYEYAADRLKRQVAVSNWRRYIGQRARESDTDDDDYPEVTNAPPANPPDTQSAG
ncbi:MAG TPA: HEAT repeat domain-containing protein [Phycisphaerae bacterium]|nr:HEAT repeat domain-containing protein [Phycisphaerae bacterium]